MNRFLPAPSTARAAVSPLVRGEMDDEGVLTTFCIAAWSCIVEPGDGIAGRLVAALGPQEALVEVVAGGRGSLAREAAGIDAEAWRKALERWRPRCVPQPVFDALRAAAHADMSLVVPHDSTWPRSLDDLGDHAPMCLWVRGEVGALTLPQPAVAIVGARAATSYGEHVAVELAAELAGRGVSIVSGAAYGIDGAAHRAALTAGGTTIALLAGGADRAYPAGHVQLIDRIAVSGAVVSEVPCGSAPTKWRFLQRNRLIAALSQATVVVEAGWRSGSLNTAAHAAAMSRPIGAVPGPVTSAASAGCHRLLREFDARCVTNADEVMELLGSPYSVLDDPDHGPAAPEQRTDETTRVRDAMSLCSWRRSEDIARRAGLAPDDVTAILGLMAVEGAAVRGSEGWRRVGTGSAASG